MREKDIFALGILFGMKPLDINKAIISYTKIRLDSNWSNVRGDKRLIIDCLYLYAKKGHTGISVEKVEKITMDLFGVGTKPNPNKWIATHGHLLV
jgi:hypothetical protein|tara:strand:+ start:2062 stop:2346 length:285 start_codon:yes stop_codon:yes gene_type:complete